MVRDELGIAFARNLDQSREGGGDTDPLGPYLPEIKNCARIDEAKWWKQAVAQAKARGLIPMLAYKVARKGWRVIIPLPDAWATGKCWREHLDYTQTMRPAGLWLLLREGGQ